MAYTKGQQLKVNTSSGNLNMRASASSSGQLITSLPKNTLVVVADPVVKSGSGSTLGWIQVTYGSYTGYVSLDYMATIATAAPAVQQSAPIVQTVSTPAVQQSVAPVVQQSAPVVQQSAAASSAYSKGQQLQVNTSGGTLNMRSGASSSDGIVASLAKGTVVTISDPIVKSGSGSTKGWILVSSNGKAGYVSLDYMTTSITPVTTSTSTAASQPAASSSSAQSIVAQKTAAMAENAAAAAAKAVEEMYNPAPSEPNAEPTADPQQIVVDAEPVSNGGSKTKKYLIIGGVVALVGIAGYLIFRKRK